MVRGRLVGEVKLPDFIRDAPELYFWLAPYYEAFRELSSCRPVEGFTGTIGRIPWTAMHFYAERNPFFAKDFDVFVFYLNILDEKLLELVKASKPKKPDKAPRTQTNPKVGR